MQCSKNFSIEVIEACCLVFSSDIATVQGPSGMCYDPDDNFIFASLGTSGAPPVGDQMVIIDSATDAVVTTISGIGVNPVQSVYSPINNRVYAIGVGGVSDQVISFDPVLQAVDAIFSPPVNTALASSSPEYDSTNNVIYFLATDTGGSGAIYLLSLDPLTNTFSTLATMPDPAPDSQLWGLKPAYCPTNNRIYVPYTFINGGTTPSIKVFSSVGILITTIAIPGATGSDFLEQLHFSSDTGFLYYLGTHAVTDLSGFIIINPADDSFVVSTQTGAGASPANYATISPECTSLCIYLSSGAESLDQYNSSTADFLCATALGASTFGVVQLATGQGGKVYVPRGTASNVRVFTPPP